MRDAGRPRPPSTRRPARRPLLPPPPPRSRRPRRWAWSGSRRRSAARRRCRPTARNCGRATAPRRRALTWWSRSPRRPARRRG
ncbi:hypothetical protein FCI23_23370 [Actinacidiphila oryziradicis]|uniref:Uncharacterized protein n=1 Tax=Actinacidiphila oryziradicis TaxID=2571141 RepID=A0A4U0SHW7_9ACTN|nr:hypothetical protein FCI23_23370 [Actinacidiphila oryziradicis]